MATSRRHLLQQQQPALATRLSQPIRVGLDAGAAVGRRPGASWSLALLCLLCPYSHEQRMPNMPLALST